MRAQSTGRLLIVVTCLIAVGAAACGGSSSKGASPTTGGGAPVVNPSTGDTAGDSAGGGDTKATCSQITKEQVQVLIVDPITKVTAKPFGPDLEGQSCAFETSNSDGALVIYVLSGQAATDAYTSDVRGLAQAVSVAGVGDKASRDASDSTSQVTSMKGDRYCSVDTQDDLVPGVSQLMDANGNTSRIGDQAYEEIANAVGTVCNLVYGSGNTTPDLTALKAAGSAAANTPTTEAELPTDFTLPTDSAP
jgi:hypothetical protein